MTAQDTKIGFFQSLRGKFVMYFLGISLIPLITVSLIAYTRSSAALKTEAENKLEAIRDIKAGQIEGYFGERLGDVMVLSENPSTVAAMIAFDKAVMEDANNIGTDEIGAMKTFRSEYLGKHELANAGDGSEYSEVHAQYHYMFQDYMEAYGYYDIFLVDPHSGAIVYSVWKEDDYGTSLANGDYANTNIGDAFRESLEAANHEFTMLEDFAYYAPSKGAASFVASPIFDGTELVGVLIFQLSIDQINQIMQERTGMGESGETYLVGEDKLMRSDSRFSEESTIYVQEIDTITAQKALEGEVGFGVVPDYRGINVLSAYKPLDLPNVQWVLLSEIDESEALAPARQMLIITLIVMGVGAVVVAIIAFLIANSVANPIIFITEISSRLAIGDADLGGIDKKISNKINAKKDELGAIGQSFNKLIAYFTEMANASQRMADGDLTADVKPKAEVDLLGNSFSQMVINLRELVGEVTDNANSMSVASQQLSAAAEQSGSATNQITTTIQQVALGTAQQSNSVNETSGSVDQMVRAIEGVAKGAQEQASAVEQSSQVTSQMSNAIQQVATNAQAGAKGAASAAETAKSGSVVVESNLEGMKLIKEKVDLSSTKVEEMGQRSNQIGMIVETIDDIASQTNLLALNAAIEAARAGEHGKGFAVVADEVRKLAERTASATKEIGSLIAEVQNTVSEAVNAMDESAGEVERGVTKAGEAGDALFSILQAVEGVNQQVEDISAAAEQMEASSHELVSAMESVSAIVEENTAATEEMTASSTEVSHSIENIASVSEENSAATEEVSASTEEMSAQVEEVTASSASLADMAQSLLEVVSQFKIMDDDIGNENLDLEAEGSSVSGDNGSSIVDEGEIILDL